VLLLVCFRSSAWQVVRPCTAMHVVSFTVSWVTDLGGG
jgi:hypothetical protein